MLNRVVRFFTSLRLTVACLTAALVLVFAGTLAQVNLGLYVTQEQYFRSLFVFWTPPGTDWKIPVWPGGYLLGSVLLVNLLAAHYQRFKFTWKKSGIFLTHVGLILLLVGQFLTEVFQVESFMRIEEGATKNFSEDGRKNELALIEVSNPDHDQVVAIPESLIAKPGEVTAPQLPFTVRVKEYFPNSWPGGPMVENAGKRIKASQGVGQRLAFDQRALTAKMNDENRPTALVEVLTPKGSLGEWAVSTWMTKYPGALREMLGDQLGSIMDQPQQLVYEGRTYQLALRPVRYYKPYSIKLLDFTHARYRGTEVAKDFSSRILLSNPLNKEEREILIYMNNPLRYGGETYFQGSFEPGDTVSILQVVRNPAWLTPYFSCALVGAGLITQFLMHLVGFLKKSADRARGRNAPGRQPAKPKAEPLEPLAVASVAAGAAAKSLQPSSKRRNS